MARIVGVDLPREKKIEISLRYVFGIGPTLSKKILADAGVDLNKRTKDLTEKEVAQITRSMQKFGTRVEGDLRRDIQQNIKRFMDIGSYRGFRHRRGLPVRGQRTHTNARTRKGPRKTVGGLKKEAPSPG